MVLQQKYMSYLSLLGYGRWLCFCCSCCNCPVNSCKGRRFSAPCNISISPDVTQETCHDTWLLLIPLRLWLLVPLHFHCSCHLFLHHSLLSWICSISCCCSHLLYLFESLVACCWLSQGVFMADSNFSMFCSHCSMVNIWILLHTQVFKSVQSGNLCSWKTFCYLISCSILHH